MEVRKNTYNNDIIGVMFASGTIQQTCAKVCSDVELLPDLVQEVTLALLTKDKAKIDALNATGKLIGYVYKMAKNQWQSATSPFYKKYKRMQDKTQPIWERKDI